MIQLWNRNTGQWESAEISTMEPADIVQYEQNWFPQLKQRFDELRTAGAFSNDDRHAVLGAHNLEDISWEWPAKFQRRRTELRWRSYALRCAGATQGLMFVDLLGLCRLAPHAGTHLAYVDLLATAPWNRRGLASQPVYKGVGNVLITEAIQLSLEEGFEGRVGLHSLPSSNAFYVECLMENLGPDSSYDDLNYYELSAERAAQFLDR